MAYSRFYVGLSLRIVGLTATLTAIAWLVSTTKMYTDIFILVAAAIIQLIFLGRFVVQVGRKISIFLLSVLAGDTSANFSDLKDDPAFRDLGAALAEMTSQLRLSRTEQVEQAQYATALIRHVPVALVAVDLAGEVQLLNLAARRLFEGPCTAKSQFPRYGEAFAASLEILRPGKGAIIRMDRKSGNVQLKASATDFALGGKRWRLISLQNIANELAAHELIAWQTVIRVIDHEVMNSLTPISSLTATAQNLVAGVLEDYAAEDEHKSALLDASEALDTVIRRSEGLLHFVQNHRRLTKPMIAKLETAPIERLFVRMQRLLAADLNAKSVQLITSIDPPTLELDADPELMDQALINLIRNAIDALKDTARGCITLSANRDPDGRPVISVSDNGPGVPISLREKVFTPFYTTKRQGSGVGLTLVRQIATVHGGIVSISDSPGGGATISFKL